MNETNDLEVLLGADTSGLRRGMSDAERIVESSSSRIRSSLESIGDIGQRLAGLGSILTASITLPLLALGTAAIKAYGDLQALELSIESVAGSAQFAGKQMESLREIAKLPGLGLKEAAKGSVGLQAIGYSAGNAEKILTQFGNAIATVGKGKQDFERAIYGVQQLANTDFPLGEDLNIIKDALPQVSTLLKEAFGTSRSDDLQKMKVSSKQVMDVILKGLEKLPRVSGGIKNAFENLGDSVQQNLARIGERIDKAFDISGIINKLTDLIDQAITAFEDLSPATQKTILVIAGLVAGIGPLVLAIGGVISILPVLASGFTALGTAITFATGPMGPILLALTALGVALYSYHSNLDPAVKNQERWNESLAKTTASAQSEIAALDTLYKKTQDHSLSLEDRNKAVDQAQKEYPGYLGNISNEAFLAGKATLAYQELRKGIMSASIARAAQAELDKRSATRLEKELELRGNINKALESYKNPKPVNISVSGGTGGVGTSLERTAEDVKNQSAKIIFENVKALKALGINFDKANNELFKKIEEGQGAIAKLDVAGPDTFLPGLEKIKKETDKQLAEIFPKGSIAELQQRADLLKKAYETSVNDIVKVRGLDKFGKETNKKGLPYFTGEIISVSEAKNRIEKLLAQISLLQVKPPEGITDFKAFRADFTTELTELGASVSENMIRIGDEFIYFPKTIALGVNNAQVELERLTKLKEDFNKTLTDFINSSIVDSISDVFASLGKAIATGENVFAALGKSLLGSFGKILTELGQQMIKYGVSLLALKFAMKTLNPYAAIAAGAALVAIGSVVTAGIQKQSDNIGGTSTSTGSSANTNYSSNLSSGGGTSGGEYIFRISGNDLISVFNRNVTAEDRVSAG